MKTKSLTEVIEDMKRTRQEAKRTAHRMAAFEFGMERRAAEWRVK